MKIAHLIAQYLYENKKMQLQGIGEFFLDNFYENPFENEKGKSKVPGNAIRFVPDKKCREDNGLVAFISTHTKKIKPLAFSDLEDFLSIGKQLLNVSKQFYIEGLGTLLLNDKGELDFLQGNEIFTAPAIDDRSSLPIKERIDDHQDNLDYEKYNSKSSNGGLKKAIIGLAFAAGVFIIGWIGWYFFNQWESGKDNTENKAENIQPVLPSTQSDSYSVSALRTDTLSTGTPAVDPATTDSSYDVIIETATKTRAFYRVGELKKIGYKVELSTKDSVRFDILTSIKGPLSDSSKVLDSITRFFGRKAKLARRE
ncbi:MAG: hypothetical protein QM763_02710 [Agriterribacter sp.]